MRTLRAGLRARSAIAFALLALFMSTVLSIATYQLARAYLLDQRETLGVRQATLDASVARGLLSSRDADPLRTVASINPLSASRVVLRSGGNWYAAVVELNEEKIPRGVATLAEKGKASRQRVTVNGTPYLVVGVPLTGLDSDYFEFIPLLEYQRTLATLLTVLLTAASMTTIAGAAAGWMASRRVLRPLKKVAIAAREMSRGDLTSRLAVTTDPDLQPVAESFNDMAASLELRIAREVRFTADVSHELRTPLTALSAAVSLAQRVPTPERATFAIDVLAQQVEQLRRLTLELLEISRFDAGVAELHCEPTDVVTITKRVIADFDLDPAILHETVGPGFVHLLDRTRFERVLANLLENACRYAGGPTAVTIGRSGTALVLTVDDDGPGVRVEEQLAVFGRFHRGSTERPADTPKGTGLGLSLVQEHVTLHKGSVAVVNRSTGGASFTVTIP